MSASAEQLAPGTGIVVEMTAGKVSAEVGYHDIALGTIVVRVPGFPGLYVVPRTSFRRFLTADECQAVNIDETGRDGFALGEWESTNVEPLLITAIVGVYEAHYGRRRPGQIWSSSHDVARSVLALAPDVEVDLDELADFTYCLDELGLLPVEVAERLAGVLLAIDPASFIAAEMADD